jgi:hypothetical protein
VYVEAQRAIKSNPKENGIFCSWNWFIKKIDIKIEVVEFAFVLGEHTIIAFCSAHSHLPFAKPTLDLLEIDSYY